MGIEMKAYTYRRQRLDKMRIIDGPIKEQIIEAIKMYDSLPNWMKEKEHRK
jgi:hypothetical protein